MEEFSGMNNRQYLKIAKELEQRIRHGYYREGEQFPSRIQLVNEFSVARATVERCISHLKEIGMLHARHGTGTFVAPSTEYKRNIAVIDWGDSIFRKFERNYSFISYVDFKDANCMNGLQRFDGIIWLAPDEPFFPRIERIRNQIPQVVVSRILPGITSVSHDHTSAYRAITLERLKRHPDATPFFLTCGLTISGYREKGFVDACRQCGRFYEIVRMPQDFAEKLERLRELKSCSGPPLLLVSDSLQHTGAVIDWVKENKWQWKKEIAYNDVDNNYPPYIWGVTVTSFLLDMETLFAQAVKKLDEMILAGRDDREHLLLNPPRREGDT